MAYYALRGILCIPATTRPQPSKSESITCARVIVVRGLLGKVVSNLYKEDFQLDDGRKLQSITSFATETPRMHAVPLTHKHPLMIRHLGDSVYS